MRFNQFLEVARDIGHYWLVWNELPRTLTTPVQS